MLSYSGFGHGLLFSIIVTFQCLNQLCNDGIDIHGLLFWCRLDYLFDFRQELLQLLFKGNVNIVVLNSGGGRLLLHLDNRGGGSTL